MKKRVVVTGIGPVTALGIGKDEFFKNLMDPKRIIKEIPNSIIEKHRIKSKFYVPTPKLDINKIDVEGKMHSLAAENSYLGVLAGQLAIEDSKININSENNIPVIMGIGIGHFNESFQNYNNYVLGKQVNRMIAPITMPNAPAAWISILLNLQGENHVINAACASSTVAIGEAYRKITNGYADTVLCGGLEYLKEDNGAYIKNFDLLTVLTQSKTGEPMPFSKERSGFLFNEGSSCCLILEEYEKAIKRGATIYCEITGYNASCDAHSIILMQQNGKRIKKMIEELIGNNKVDYYNAHGTATILNDKVEAQIITEIFGNIDKQPHINSTKGVIGHSFGASGAIEAAVCAYSIKNNILHGNNIENPLESLKLVYKPTRDIINCAVSASFGFGGHNASLMFHKIESA